MARQAAKNCLAFQETGSAFPALLSMWPSREREAPARQRGFSLTRSLFLGDGDGIQSHQGGCSPSQCLWDLLMPLRQGHSPPLVVLPYFAGAGRQPSSSMYVCNDLYGSAPFGRFWKAVEAVGRGRQAVGRHALHCPFLQAAV